MVYSEDQIKIKNSWKNNKYVFEYLKSLFSYTLKILEICNVWKIFLPKIFKVYVFWNENLNFLLSLQKRVFAF